MNRRQRIGTAISGVLKVLIAALGVWALLKNQDVVWAFASFFVLFLSLSPVIIRRNLNISLPWLLELLVVIPLALHVWGGVLNFYSTIPFYDKMAHFVSVAVIAFIALVIVYVIDVYWDGLKMDLVMMGFFIAIFAIALGAIWEIGEYVSDMLVVGAPKAQEGLDDTMMDLVYDTAAGVIVAVAGTIAIRRGELVDLIASVGTEAKKIAGRRFLQAKEQAMARLEKDIENGEVDEPALPVLEQLNAIEDFYTTSSCSGRIVVMEVPTVGDKRGARFLGSWDGAVSVDDIRTALRKASEGELWLLAQPPIFHVAAALVDRAQMLVSLARESGFKQSSIKSLGDPVMVEVGSTEEMDVPLGRDGVLLCSDAYLELLVSIANELMRNAARKRAMLMENLAGQR
ncbi:MAG: hypothetical protein R6U10_03210 [Thermoplasmatota archaeon]